MSSNTCGVEYAANFKEAIGSAEAIGIVVPSAIKEALICRGTMQAFNDGQHKDIAALLCPIGQHSHGLAALFDASDARLPKLQERFMMRSIMDVLRTGGSDAEVEAARACCFFQACKAVRSARFWTRS